MHSHVSATDTVGSWNLCSLDELKKRILKDKQDTERRRREEAQSSDRHEQQRLIRLEEEKEALAFLKEIENVCV